MQPPPTLSLLSPPTDNSTTQNLSQSSLKIKCYYHHTCCYDYFRDPIPDDAVIYAYEIPFQYNKIESMYTEFIGNPITVFIADRQITNVCYVIEVINLICQVIQLIFGS